MRDALTDLSGEKLRTFDDIIDVRSPSEFEDDHIPGAINLPVLDDEQRAEVGYVYKQVSRFEARRLGAGLVAENIAHHLKTSLNTKAANYKALIYCWRGGMRSGAMATVFDQIGWDVCTLEGGYKRYRAHVSQQLYDSLTLPPVILIDGNTGTGKTALLHKLKEMGHSIIDLEGLAQHRGSLFGGFSLEGQPSQKRFESNLLEAISKLDPDRPVCIEAESNRVGRRTLPPRLWQAMQAAPRIEITVPLHERAKHTLATYPDILSHAERLQTALEQLVEAHGHKCVQAWQNLAHQGAFLSLACELMQHHYDPRYARSRKRQDGVLLKTLYTDKLDQSGLENLALQLIETAELQ